MREVYYGRRDRGRCRIWAATTFVFGVWLVTPSPREGSTLTDILSPRYVPDINYIYTRCFGLIPYSSIHSNCLSPLPTVSGLVRRRLFIFTPHVYYYYYYYYKIKIQARELSYIAFDFFASAVSRFGAKHASYRLFLNTVYFKINYIYIIK